jgi:hypothetical protein
MGRKKKTTPTIEEIAAFTEEAANEIFLEAKPIDKPKLTWATRIWERDLFCVLLDENASVESKMALEIVRRASQKKFKRPLCVVCYIGVIWNWEKKDDRAKALVSAHGGELG